MKDTHDTTIFASTPVNTGRQPELDMAKFVLILMLALIHCTIECTPEPGLDDGLPFLMDSVIGGPLGAPMFIFAMGFGLAYTPHNSPRDCLKRSLSLALVGLLLNVCRFLLPFLAGWALTGDAERYLDPLPYRVFGNDILQFAAIAFLIFALFRRLKLSPGAMLTVGLVCSLAGSLFRTVCVDSQLANVLLAHLVGVENPPELPYIYSDFPLLNWLIVPILGYLFANRLRYVQNKNRFYAAFSPICLLVAGVYFWYAIPRRLGMFGPGQNSYYHITTPEVLVSIAAALGLLGVYHMLCSRLPAAVLDVIGRVSRNLNAVYCIHWVLVSSIAIVLLDVVRGSSYLPVWNTMLLGAFISMLAIDLSLIWSEQLRPWLRAALMRKGDLP